MRAFLNHARRFRRDQRGGTAIEYGFIAALIVVAIIGSISALADVTTGMWNNVSESVRKNTPHG
jgi:pilus assembly protein Flp/PilA